MTSHATPAHVVMTVGKSPGVVTTALKALSCAAPQGGGAEAGLPVAVRKLHLLCIPSRSPSSLPPESQVWLSNPFDAGLDQFVTYVSEYWPFATQDFKGEIAQHLGNASPTLSRSLRPWRLTPSRSGVWPLARPIC
jgi:hypothetical protein